MSLSTTLQELYTGLLRQGPGSFSSTKKAYDSVAPLLPKAAQILNIGSGPGLPAIHLAQLSKADTHILALDMHIPYLEQLQKMVAEQSFEEKITVRRANLVQAAEKLDLEKESFDLIWSEATAYIMGFTKTLRAWHEFLRKQGYIVVSELSWLKKAPKTFIPAHTYWSKGYPSMGTIAENLSVLQRVGYKYCDHFILPQEDWWTEYYTPLEQRIQTLLTRHENDIDIVPALEAKQREIDIVRNHGDSFAYVFYIACKE